MPKRKFTFISARNEKSRSGSTSTEGLSISCTITKRISTYEWAKYRDVIREKYIDDGWILDDVLQYLRHEKGFKPSKHQLSLQLSKWGFVKKSSHLRKSSQTSQARLQNGSSGGDNDFWKFTRNPGTFFSTHTDPRSIRPKNSTGNLSNTTTLVSSAASIYHKSVALEKLAAIEDDEGQYTDWMHRSSIVKQIPLIEQTVPREDDWAIKLSEELDRARISFNHFDGNTPHDVSQTGHDHDMAFSQVPTLVRSLSSSTLSDYAEFRAMKRRLENPADKDKEDCVQDALASLERLSLDHVFKQSEVQSINTRPSTGSGKSASTGSWTEEFFGADVWQ